MFTAAEFHARAIPFMQSGLCFFGTYLKSLQFNQLSRSNFRVYKVI